MTNRSAAAGPTPHIFPASNLVPNNRLPLLHYRRGLDVAHLADPEAALDAMFARHGWTRSWVNGIYGFHHYHATTHEVLGIARGSATVLLGGPAGQAVEIASGDIVVVPAGVGHCLVAGHQLSVVGAYPTGSPYDLRRATTKDLRGAAALIAGVPMPATDPVHGVGGPLCSLWTPAP